MQLPAQEQSAALFTVDGVDCRRQSLRQVWLTCLRYSFNYKCHEHTFRHRFDIETFCGFRAPSAQANES